MAYSDFTFKEVSRRFGLVNLERDYYGTVPELNPSATLQSLMSRYYSLARANSTEKARSEFLIAPILAEIRFHLHEQVSLFSGIDFPAAPDQGLNGVCDFLMSRSPEQQFLTAPIIAVVEAKNENLKTGIGQCVAEMVGARIFNEREGIVEPRLYGVVTTGNFWQFLQLENNIIGLDGQEYHVKEVAKILGILAMMLTPSSAPIPRTLDS